MGKRGTIAKNKLPIASAVAVSTSNKAPDEIRWKAEDALRDIERAERHKQDPKLMKHVEQMAREKMSALKKICK